MRRFQHDRHLGEASPYSLHQFWCWFCTTLRWDCGFNSFYVHNFFLNQIFNLKIFYIRTEFYANWALMKRNLNLLTGYSTKTPLFILWILTKTFSAASFKPRDMRNLGLSGNMNATESPLMTLGNEHTSRKVCHVWSSVNDVIWWLSSCDEFARKFYVIL